MLQLGKSYVFNHSTNVLLHWIVGTSVYYHNIIAHHTKPEVATVSILRWPRRPHNKLPWRLSIFSQPCQARSGLPDLVKLALEAFLDLAH